MSGYFFRDKQSIYIPYEQHFLAATVIKAELIQIGAKSFTGEASIGRIVDQT